MPPATLLKFTVCVVLPVTVTLLMLICGGAGARTVRARAPETVLSTVDVAVIVAVPGATAVILPVASTVAVAAELEAHVTVFATPDVVATVAPA
jgi:hypothetical protein